MSPIIQLDWKETVVNDDPETTSALARHFARHHAILLHDTLKPDFYDKLCSLCAQATFVTRDAAELGRRTVEHPEFGGALLREAFMQPAMLSWIQKVTDCGPIDDAIGAIARYEAGTDSRLEWHNDLGKFHPRALAMTVNLGREPYEGGEFELRGRDSPEILFRHVHSKPGMALIFRVSPALLHRVLPVTSGGPRTVFFGWYLKPSTQLSGRTLDP